MACVCLSVNEKLTKPFCSPLSISKDKFSAKDNGVPLGELDEATQQKAEAHYFSFYELHVDADPKANGPADFH